LFEFALDSKLEDSNFLKKLTLSGDEAREEALDILKENIEERKKK